MIKRMNKLTAILVAATAVATLAPATSVSAATNLATLDGNIDDVQVFDGGKYVFNGYKNDDQESGFYYFNGIKDIELDDINENGVKYGKNFLSFEDKDLLLNLTNGKKENDTADDKKDLMEVNLKNKVVKKAKRYEDTQDLSFVTQINRDQFGDVWYQYIASNSDDSKAYTIFVNTDGKYVDASELLNIVHYTKSGTKVNITNASDLKDKGYTISVGKVLFADANYIYRSVKLTNNSDSADTGVYLQKISKAQGDTEDGAYLPKSVESYSLGDVSEADLTPASGLSIRTSGYSIYAIKTTSSKLTVQKYDLKKVRESGINKAKVQLDDDYDNIKNEDMTAFDIDVNGNPWILYKGEIKKVYNGKIKTMYKVDTGMNKLSVYDDDDLMAWNTSNEVYSVVKGTVIGNEQNGGQNTTKPEEEKPTVKAGWNKNANGTWSLIKADGTKTTGWAIDGGTWYYLDGSGIMQTGWIKDGSTWYYLNGSGAMQTGWLQSGATWYYLNKSGAMATGWLNDNGTWYYLNESGAMLSNTTISGYKLGPSGAWIK